MSSCYRLIVNYSSARQTGAEETFIGGKPKLFSNEKIPVCKLCGIEQTFFFQVAFPVGHIWEGLSLAVFACTACADRDHLIPEMLKVPFSEADIPDGFLESYQTNFRFLVFRTAGSSVVSSYSERVTFREVRLARVMSPNEPGCKIGGVPNWLLEAESPKSYAGRTSMFFLLQLGRRHEFEILADAPQQITLGLDRKPKPSNLGYYELFIGNAIYLFGTKSQNEHLVYAITQV
jgi:hypothetical protein